jgi:hypothetical protein
VVSVATACEALLVSGRETPTRALSERAAFLLADTHERRASISRALKAFYDIRSDAVHGKWTGEAAATLGLWLDAGFRLALAVAATICANRKTWPTLQAIIEWTEDRRWGARSAPPIRPVNWAFIQRSVQTLSTR